MNRAEDVEGVIGELLDTGDSTFNVHVQERDIIVVPPTVLAKLGYFLSDLIFPVTQVAREISSALFLFYPVVMGYLVKVFGGQTLIYALLFILESVFLYLYFYCHLSR